MIFNLIKPAPPPPAPRKCRLQIIGLKTLRVSGIQMSRSAYTEPLRQLFPDLLEVDLKGAQANTCGINLWAQRAMSVQTLKEVRALPGHGIWCIVLESTALQPGVLATAEAMEQVWVPTTFVRDVCIKGGVPAEKIHIIPYYLHSPKRPRVLPTESDPFTVLVSWDDASNMERKNVIGSIKAFKKAWPQSNKVRLRLKTRDLRESNAILIQDAINQDSRIILDNGFVESVDEVFDGAHVLFHIHRAEGYGRHMIEAMQRELPVIATAYSGCMDWLTPDNSMLVDYTMKPTDQEKFQYPVGGLWAEPNIDQAVDQLRWCRDHYDTLVQEKVAQAKKDAASATSMSQVLEAMRSALERL